MTHIYSFSSISPRLKGMKYCGSTIFKIFVSKIAQFTTIYCVVRQPSNPLHSEVSIGSTP